MSIRDCTIGLAVSVLLLLAVEGVARVINSLEDDSSSTQLSGPPPDPAITLSPLIGWTLTPNYTGPIPERERHPRAFDPQGHLAIDSAQIEDTTRPKIVTIGDSNTFGWGVPTHDTWVEVLDRALDADVINLGVYGYTSYQGRLSLERYLAEGHRVDLVVVSFSYNDRRYIYPGEHPDSPDRFAPIAETGLQTPRALERSHGWRAFRRLVRLTGLIQTPPPVLTEAHVGDLRPRVDEMAYQQHLSDIVTLARARRIAVLLLLLADNPIQTHQLHVALDQPHPDRLAHLAYLADLKSPQSVLARRLLMETARAHGDMAIIERHSVVRLTRSLGGGDVVRLDREYHDLVRRVGIQHGVTVVDGAAQVRPHEYIDQCHFNTAAHRRLGEHLANVIRAHGVSSPIPYWLPDGGGVNHITQSGSRPTK